MKDLRLDNMLDPQQWEELRSRLEVIVIALNWESGYRSLRYARHCTSTPTTAQRVALEGLARRVLRAMSDEKPCDPDLDWNERLKDRRIA